MQKANIQLKRSFSPSSTFLYLASHAGAVMCFFVTPSLFDVGTAILLYIVTGGLGWSVGIHRCLVHRSFATYRWVENIFGFLGTLSGLGGPISSSRTHFIRDYCQSNHGVRSAGLPGSLLRSYLRAPFFTSCRLEPSPSDPVTGELEQRWVFRLAEQRLLLCAALGCLLYATGGLSLLIWGLFVRLAVTLNVFALFDYFCHSPRWGSQRFEISGVPTEGRNNLIVGIITCGEGWHNNHHAMPTSPRLGVGRWEPDVGYWFIWLMQRVGLAWDAVDPKQALRKGAHLATSKSVHAAGCKRRELPDSDSYAQ